MKPRNRKKAPGKRPPLTLTEGEVMVIHEALVRDFQESPDPISPSGVRDPGLLSSAVSRQHTSLGETLKYPHPVANATTLMYGICNDHVFFNGNKRTALVAMLAHLDRNDLVLNNTDQAELYDFMLSVADHSIGLRNDPRARRTRDDRRDADEEVAAAVKWLDPRVKMIDRAERFITYRDLRRILSRFGCVLDEAKGNRIVIYKVRKEVVGLFKKREVERRERLGSIPFPGDSRQMSIGDTRHVRKICKLTEHDGCDSASFYDYESIVDGFINHYRKILLRLAKI